MIAWWLPVVSGLASSLLGSIFSGDDKQAEFKWPTPRNLFQAMPPQERSRWEQTMQNMPTQYNVGFGGQNYPVINQKALRAAGQLYNPNVSPMVQQPGTTFGQRLAGGITGAMPGIMQGLSQWNNTNVQPAIQQISQPSPNYYGMRQAPGNNWARYY
ncbi:hypothetical protein LCGC14_1331450 [marine sediment metagenome]|uniref:Uncharacterized protein n=1 Tax=marine sediment metagenome TaxID=412755 RepID=A0A0F9KGJ3_9ZZZZ